jgi:hypothetical protein
VDWSEREVSRSGRISDWIQILVVVGIDDAVAEALVLALDLDPSVRGVIDLQGFVSGHGFEDGWSLIASGAAADGVLSDASFA